MRSSEKILAFSGPVCLLLLCGILAAGLWPFQSPRNGVQWLHGEKGLRFERHGTAFSVGALSPLRTVGSPCSIEVWAQPAKRSDSRTILEFYAPQNPYPLQLNQSLTDLYIGHGAAERRHGGLYLPNQCLSLRPVFLTLSSAKDGTTIYLDGAAVRNAPGFSISGADCSGQVILGTAPISSSSWSGNLRGLAIYHGGLSPDAVARHYRSWVGGGRPELTGTDNCAALYLFDEGRGGIAHNRCGTAPDLLIPERYQVVDQAFLQPFWDVIDVPDMVRNVAAFIPMGFFLCGYFTHARPAWATVTTVTLAGGLLSLLIELLQHQLPTRQSDSMDLIMNTAGAWLGAIFFRRRFAG